MIDSMETPVSVGSLSDVSVPALPASKSAPFPPNARFELSVPAVPVGEVISSTATDSAGNTWEYSAILVNSPPVAVNDHYTVGHDQTLVANHATAPAA